MRGNIMKQRDVFNSKAWCLQLYVHMELKGAVCAYSCVMLYKNLVYSQPKY